MDPKHQAQTPSIRQSKEALLEAAQAAITDQRDRPVIGLGRRPPSGPGRQIFRLTLSLLIAAGTLILLARPSWLAGPGLPEESSAVRAASATLSLVDAMSKVKAFSELRGRLPSRLQEVGVSDREIRYRVVEGTTFEISVAAGDSVVSLRSTDSLKPRIIDAILALQRRA